MPKFCVHRSTIHPRLHHIHLAVPGDGIGELDAVFHRQAIDEDCDVAFETALGIEEEACALSDCL